MKLQSAIRAAFFAMLIAAPVAAFAHPTNETAHTRNTQAQDRTPSARVHNVPTRHGH